MKSIDNANFLCYGIVESTRRMEGVSILLKKKLTHDDVKNYIQNLKDLREEVHHKIQEVAHRPEHEDIHDLLHKKLELLKFIEKQIFMLTGEEYEVARLMLDNAPYKVSVKHFWERYEKGESSFNRRKKEVVEKVMHQCNQYLEAM